PDEGAHEAAAPREGSGGRHRAAGGQRGGRQAVAPRQADLVAPFVGAVAERLQDAAGEGGGVGQRGGGPVLGQAPQAGGRCRRGCLAVQRRGAAARRRGQRRNRGLQGGAHFLT